MTAREKLLHLMQALVSDGLSVQEFCAEYERVWNFELEPSALAGDEDRVFRRVFDTAAWYTPVEEDRASYPGFRDEESVLAVVRGLWQRYSQQTGGVGERRTVVDLRLGRPSV